MESTNELYEVTEEENMKAWLRATKELIAEAKKCWPEDAAKWAATEESIAETVALAQKERK